MMSIDKITIVITDENFGDVSFRDEYSAKVFDNTYNSMYGDCGVIDLTDLTIIDSAWSDYFEARKGSGITHTLEYYLDRNQVDEVVQMLESLYTVEIVHIESTETDWDGGVTADLSILKEDESC